MAPAKKHDESVESSKNGKVPPLFEPISLFFEKKVRNIEKRKTKLESYRVLQKEGKLTDPGQIKAVQKYDECAASHTFVTNVMQEILPILMEINTGIEKAASAKEREKDRAIKSTIREVLDIQDLYEHMGDQTVRSHFCAGERNAPKLTESQLQTVDKLFLASKPSRLNSDGTFKQKDDYKTALDESVSSWYRLLNKAGPIQGSDLKCDEMRTLFQSISSCDYFDTPLQVEEEVPTETMTEEPVVEEPKEPIADVQPEHLTAENLTVENFTVENLTLTTPVTPEETFQDKQQIPPPPTDYMATYQRRLVNFVQDEVPPNIDTFIGSPAESSVAFNGNYQDNVTNCLPARPHEKEEVQQFVNFNGTAFANDKIGDNEINNNFPNVKSVPESNPRGSFPPMESWADEAPEPFDPSLNSGSGDNMFVEVRRGGGGSNQAPRYGRGGGGMSYNRGGGSYRGGDFRGDRGSRGGNRNYEGGRGSYGRPYRGDFRDDGQGGGNYYRGGGGQGGYVTKEFSSRGGGRGGRPMRGNGVDRNGMNHTAATGGR